MKIVVIPDDEDFDDAAAVGLIINTALAEDPDVEAQVSIMQPDAVLVAWTDVTDDDALKLSRFNICAAGSLLEGDQGKLLDTLNHLTETLGRPVML
ncbi:MAG TPA: hypothetical protein VN888_00380 [Mycobacterium sp.]|nr:hypothetical protein [Mycobacterium sp.]